MILITYLFFSFYKEEEEAFSTTTSTTITTTIDDDTGKIKRILIPIYQGVSNPLNLHLFLDGNVNKQLI